MIEFGYTEPSFWTLSRQTYPLPPQLYMLVLSLEDLERRALSLPEEDRSLMLAQRDEICSEMFSLLKLKTLDQQWNKYESVCVCYSSPLPFLFSLPQCPSSFLHYFNPTSSRSLNHPPPCPGEMNRYSNM